MRYKAYYLTLHDNNVTQFTVLDVISISLVRRKSLHFKASNQASCHIEGRKKHLPLPGFHLLMHSTTTQIQA